MEAEASSSDGSTTSVKVKTELKSPVVPYEVNSMILCSHTDNLFYEAKIIAVKVQANGNHVYTVHYQGWSKRYDENIPHSRSASRFRPFTAENIELAKIEMREAKARAAELTKKKKPQKAEIRRGRSALLLSDPSSNTFHDEKMTTSHSIRGSSTEGLSRSPSINETVSIPEKLKAMLENDRRLVENELKLPCVPCRLTVSNIMKEYVMHVRKLDAVCSEVKVHKGRARYWKGVVAALDECTDNMKSFFDLVVASDILYPNEKLRHKDLTEEISGVIYPYNNISDLLNEPKKGLRASEYYGFIYLLRLLIRFPEMVEYMLCDSDSKEILAVFVQSFVRYLGSNSEKFFDPELDYETVTEEYKLRLLQNSKI